MGTNNYLPKNEMNSRQRANRATTATRQSLFDMGSYPNFSQGNQGMGNRVFSAQQLGTPSGDEHHQDYI